TGVGDCDDDIAAGLDRTMRQLSPLSQIQVHRLHVDATMPMHGLRRIRTKIEDDLLELCRLCHDAGTVRHFLKDQIDVPRQGCPQKRLGFGHRMTHVARAAPSAAPPAKSQEVIDNIAPSFAGSANFRQVPRVAAALGDMCFGYFNITKDRGYDVVKVVRDTAGESAHCISMRRVCCNLSSRSAFRCGSLPFRGTDKEIERHRQDAELARMRDSTRTSDSI